jgi:hypothetical protein
VMTGGQGGGRGSSVHHTGIGDGAAISALNRVVINRGWVTFLIYTIALTIVDIIRIAGFDLAFRGVEVDGTVVADLFVAFVLVVVDIV